MLHSAQLQTAEFVLLVFQLGLRLEQITSKGLVKCVLSWNNAILLLFHLTYDVRSKSVRTGFIFPKNQNLLIYYFVSFKIVVFRCYTLLPGHLQLLKANRKVIFSWRFKFLRRISFYYFHTFKLSPFQSNFVIRNTKKVSKIISEDCERCWVFFFKFRTESALRA